MRIPGYTKSRLRDVPAAARHRGRAIAGRCGFMFLSACVGLIAVEIALYRMEPLLPSMFVPDDVLLYGLKAGARKVFVHVPENGGGRIAASINSDGFRGPELDSKKTHPRIMVYGDSCIQAEFSEAANTYAARLRRHIEDAGRSVEVVNAGVVGYGPDQAILKMERDIPAFEPDAVILAIFADNDFGDLLRNRLFRLDAEDNLRRSAPWLNADLSDQMQSYSSPPWWMRNQIGLRVLRAYWKWWKKVEQPALWTGDYLEDSLIRCKLEYEEAVIEGILEVTNLLDDYDDVDISHLPDSASARYKIRLMDRLVAHAADFLNSRNIPFMILIIPSPVDVCDEFPHKPNVALYPEYDPARLSRTVEEIASRHDIPFVNLFDEFRSRGADSFYLKGGDDHWNDPGQDLAARLSTPWCLDVTQ